MLCKAGYVHVLLAALRNLSISRNECYNGETFTIDAVQMEEERADYTPNWYDSAFN